MSRVRTPADPCRRHVPEPLHRLCQALVEAGRNPSQAPVNCTAGQKLQCYAVNMLTVFEELARITAAELTCAVDEIQGIDCLGAAFCGEHGDFRVGWTIDLGWCSIPVQLIVHPGDVEEGEDWLLERYARCIFDSLASVHAFMSDRVDAVA